MVRTHQYKYVRRLDELDEFYDLSIDAENSNNLINDPNYINQILELKERMLKWYQETADAVPFELDERMAKSSLLKYIKPRISFKKYIMLKIALKRGMSVSKLMKMIQNK
jgi:hypothetical protein